MRHALAIKSETDDTLVLEGWGVIFTGPDSTDLTGDFFTKSTDFWLDRLGGPARPVLYNHGFDGELKRSVIGTGSLEYKAADDSEGLWFTAQLEKSQAYVKQIRALAEAGLLGASTGAISHLVEREAKTADASWLKSWPIGEVSLTVTPAEPRTIGIAEVRTLVDDLEAKAKLNAAARHELPDSDFAYIDRHGGRHLPIQDEAHVRAAMGGDGFSKQEFESEAAKKKAARKILARARKFGIDIADGDAVAEAAKSLKALSYEQVQDQVRLAVNRASYPGDTDDGMSDMDYSCVVATYPDAVVVERCDYDQDGDGGLWRFPYTVDPATNQVTLGEPERVEQNYSPIAKSLAALKALLDPAEVKATEPQPADAATKAAELSTEETEMSQEILDAIKALSDRLDTQEAAAKSAEPEVKTGGVAVPAIITNPSKDSSAEAEFKAFLRGMPVKAALNEGTNSQGGYAVPAQYSNDLVRPLTDLSYLRLAGARVINVQGTDAFHVPSLTYASAASLTSEAASYTEAEPTMGEVLFQPWKLTRLSKVSEELAADSRFDLWGQILNPDFAQSFATAENSYFTTGTGTSQPSGVVTGATSSVFTEATGNTTSVTADGIISTFFTLDYKYRQNAVWMMNDATLQLVRKLKDSQNRYLFEMNPFTSPGMTQIGAAQGPAGVTSSGMLLGKPVITNNSMATAAANAVTILFGDFSYYWIADWAGLEMQRLSELYAANGQVGFRAFRRVDAHLMLAAAIAAHKQSAT